MSKIQTSTAGERTRPRPPPKAKRPTGAKSSPKPAGRRPAKRFVEPVRLDGDAHDAIINTLESAGIGDASGHEIFVVALGYDLANLLQAVADATSAARPTNGGSRKELPQPVAAKPKQAPASSAEAEVFGALADAARTLLAQLAALDAGGREQLSTVLRRNDRFSRDYGAEYLDAVDAELRRLAEAAAAAKATPPVEPAPTPKVTLPKPANDAATETATLNFIRHVARIYSQCFDQAPSAKANAPFAKVLRIIAKRTDAPLTLTAEMLRRALADGADAPGG
jgi:hypothetical protein